jgi:hypothetical protein
MITEHRKPIAIYICDYLRLSALFICDHQCFWAVVQLGANQLACGEVIFWLPPLQCFMIKGLFLKITYVFSNGAVVQLGANQLACGEVNYWLPPLQCFMVKGLFSKITYVFSNGAVVQLGVNQLACGEVIFWLPPLRMLSINDLLESYALFWRRAGSSVGSQSTRLRRGNFLIASIANA